MSLDHANPICESGFRDILGEISNDISGLYGFMIELITSKLYGDDPVVSSGCEGNCAATYVGSNFNSGALANPC